MNNFIDTFKVWLNHCNVLPFMKKLSDVGLNNFESLKTFNVEKLKNIKGDFDDKQRKQFICDIKEKI